MDTEGIDLDPSIRRLVQTLNALPGVNTFSSCGGHEDPTQGQEAAGHFQVNFNLTANRRGWKSLKLIQWSIQQINDLHREDTLCLNVWVDPGEDENDPDAGILCFELHGNDFNPDELAEILESLFVKE